jgi:signal transduction histidine kinase
MFYRGQSDVPGSGLGLYIAKRISAKLDGSITIVDGVNGVGLGFEVSFENKK